MNLHKLNKKELIEEILRLRSNQNDNYFEEDLENQAQIKALEALENPQSVGHYFKETLEKINLFSISLDVNGNIIFCNHYILRLTGWTEKELIGKNFFDILVPENERIARFRAFRQSIQHQKFWHEAEKTILAKNGEVLYVLFSLVELRSNDGQVLGVTKVGHDITESKKVSMTLHQTNEVLQDLFDNSNDLILICSIRGQFLFVNKTFKKKLGYDNEELKKINIRDLINPKSWHSTFTSIKKILRKEYLYKFKTIFLSKSGKNIYLEGTVTFRYENGTPVALRGILYDITEKIRAEKAQSLYYSIGNLTVKSKDLNHLYQSIHQELAKVIEVKNFYIKLFDRERELLLFPYYVDEFKKHEVKVTQRKAGGGLSDYVITRKKALFLYEEEIENLLKNEKLQLFSPLPKVWIGVPLKFENEVIGLISVKSYNSRGTYDIGDLELLDFVSGQIALAIQRKKNEEQLVNQTAQLKAIFESSSHIMWSLDRSYCLTSFNQNYKNYIKLIYGVEPETHKELSELRSKLKENNKFDFWKEKYEKAFEGEVQYFQTRYQTARQGYRWQEVYLNPIQLPNGRIDEISAIAHDITDKKLSEIALVESEEKFRNIFESFQDVYYRSDLRGNITLVSPSIEEMGDYTPQELVGMNVRELCEDTKPLKKAIFELYRNNKIRNLPLSLRSKKGDFVPTISNIRLIFDTNTHKAIAIEGVVRDITEIKKASEEVLKAKELAERSLKVKQTFLANMSHEIRTPMNGVIGMIDLMLDTTLNQEQQSYMHTIKKSSETLLYILNDILDLSKIEAGKMELHKKPVDVKRMLEKLHALFLQQANIKENQLNYTIDSKISPYLLIDETRLLQIFSNLTSNAIKFTQEGKIDIVLSCIRKKNDIHLIKAEVKDTGIGITQEDQDRLFNTFSQLDNSLSKGYAGTGLGLAISKELCKLMNGEIGVESQKGKGSIFWFTFEAEATKEKPKEDALQKLQFHTKAHFGTRKPAILVVDDNTINRQVAKEILLKSGCDVILAESGVEAIANVKKQNFDLILMDIQMPDMDGVEATKIIKNTIRKAIPPIIAMTAYSMREDRQRFLEQGLDGYLAKPIKALQLVEVVKKYLFEKDYNAQQNLINLPILEQNAIQSKAIINLETLEQLAKYGGAEMIEEVFADFQKETQEVLKNCKTASRKKNYQLIQRELHTLKGTSGTIGLDRLSEATRILEEKLKSGEVPENIKEEILTLEKHFKEFIYTYQQNLTQHQDGSN